MKICITSQGKELVSKIGQGFERSQYLIIVDLESLEFEAIKNPSIDAAGRAGIRLAQLIAEKGVETLITGHCETDGLHIMEAAGIEVIDGISGRVCETLEGFRRGDFKTELLIL